MNNLEPVRQPLRRIVFHMEPVDSNTPVAVAGPLEVVGRPLRRAEMISETALDLELELEPNSDPVAITVAFIDLLRELDRHSRLTGGGGLIIDTKWSRSTQGRVFLRIVPYDICTADIRTQSQKIPGVKDIRIHRLAA